MLEKYSKLSKLPKPESRVGCSPFSTEKSDPGRFGEHENIQTAFKNELDLAWDAMLQLLKLISPFNLDESLFPDLVGSSK